MSIEELNREQLIELKQAMYSEINHAVSYGELAEADSLISDKKVFERFADTEFSEDDFFCKSSSTVEEDTEKLIDHVQSTISENFLSLLLLSWNQS